MPPRSSSSGRRLLRRASARACTARAVLAQACGRTAEARTELQQALAADPLSFDALSRLVDLAIASGRPGDALAAARAAAARAPHSPRHLALLGETLLASGQPAEAEPFSGKPWPLAPDSDALRLDLARAHLREGDGAAALAVLDVASASRDRSALRGAALTQLQRWADAASAYRDALGRGNESAPLLNGLAWAELRSGRRDEARHLLERSLAVDAAQPPIRRLLADVQTGPGATLMRPARGDGGGRARGGRLLRGPWSEPQATAQRPAGHDRHVARRPRRLLRRPGAHAGARRPRRPRRALRHRDRTGAPHRAVPRVDPHGPHPDPPRRARQRRLRAPGGRAGAGGAPSGCRLDDRGVRVRLSPRPALRPGPGLRDVRRSPAPRARPEGARPTWSAPRTRRPTKHSRG